jgi:hypothetical protein
VLRSTFSSPAYFVWRMTVLHPRLRSCPSDGHIINDDLIRCCRTSRYARSCSVVNDLTGRHTDELTPPAATGSSCKSYSTREQGLSGEFLQYRVHPRGVDRPRTKPAAGESSSTEIANKRASAAKRYSVSRDPRICVRFVNLRMTSADLTPEFDLGTGFRGTLAPFLGS